MKSVKSRSMLISCVATVVSLFVTEESLASLYRVEVDTSSIVGTPGAIALDYTSSTPYDNAVYILNFSHNGTTGLPETEGGLVQGDIILLLNPAPFTIMSDGSFFNEIVIPFDSFGTSISFVVQLSENGPPPGALPDEFSFFLLGENRLPMFATGDPLGAEGLFTICVDGTSDGLLMPFTPTEFTPPELLEIVVDVACVNELVGASTVLPFEWDANWSGDPSGTVRWYLSSDDFDVTEVEPTSLRLNGTVQPVLPVQYQDEFAGEDGPFLVARFPRGEAVDSVEPGGANTEVVLTGAIAGSAVACVRAESVVSYSAPEGEEGVTSTVLEGLPTKFDARLTSATGREGVSFSVALPVPSELNAHVYSVNGRLVATLMRGTVMEAGIHELTWNGRDRSGRVVSGVYFLRVSVPGESRTMRTITLQ